MQLSPLKLPPVLPVCWYASDDATLFCEWYRNWGCGGFDRRSESETILAHLSTRAITVCVTHSYHRQAVDEQRDISTCQQVIDTYGAGRYTPPSENPGDGRNSVAGRRGVALSLICIGISPEKVICGTSADMCLASA
jgi:hypothetical protein